MSQTSVLRFDSGSRADRLGAAIGVTVAAAIAGWLIWRSIDGLSVVGAAVFTWFDALWLVGPWCLAAAGLGAWLRTSLAPRAPAAAALGLGAAAQLLLDATAARFGVVGPIAAWALLVPGLITGFLELRRAGTRGTPVTVTWPPWTWWCAAPALGALFLAAASAPGWLWTTEFGGYDALAYHLQLPREWLAAGRVEGLPHNVYAFFPSFVESTYTHVFARAGDPDRAAPACQILHALLAVAAAVVTAALVRKDTDRLIAPLAGVFVLVTPWVIVTGSLAYNESAVLLALATALVLTQKPVTLTRFPAPPPGGAQPSKRPAAPTESAEVTAAPTGRKGVSVTGFLGWRLVAALGLVVGCACGAKLSAVGFVAVPVGLLVLCGPGPRGRAFVRAVGVAGVTLLVLAPWALTTWRATGSPVFPFGTDLLGTGGWTADQADRWALGHRFDGGLAARLGAGVNEWLRYGWGPRPGADPWIPQWSILPAAALVAAVALLVTRRRRAAAVPLIVLGVQVAFWLGATHIKSRFMLPSIIPCVWLILLAYPLSGRWFRFQRWVIGAAVLSLLPVLLLQREGNHAPTTAIGASAIFRGDALDAVVGDGPPPSFASIVWWINHRLPRGSRVLGVGEATGFYYDLDRFQTTSVWDRGVFAEAIRRTPADGARLLRDAGITHVLVNRTMLDRWVDAGWGDPEQTSEAVEAWLADAGAEPIANDSSNRILYGLAPP